MLRQMFEEALKRRTQEFGRNDAHTAQASRDLGLFLQRNGDRAGARLVLTETVAIDDAVLGKSDPQTLEDVSALAAVSPPGVAAPLLQRAAESPDATVAGPALSTLADLRTAAGDRAGAAVYLRRALEKAEAADGKDGMIVALILNALALDVEPKVGVTYLERALKIDRSILGERDPATILTEENMSKVLFAGGWVDDALAMGRTTLGASEAAFGPNDARTRKCARELAALLRQTGKISEAAVLERKFSVTPAR